MRKTSISHGRAAQHRVSKPKDVKKASMVGKRGPEQGEEGVLTVEQGGRPALVQDVRIETR